MAATSSLESRTAFLAGVVSASVVWYVTTSVIASWGGDDEVAKRPETEHPPEVTGNEQNLAPPKDKISASWWRSRVGEMPATARSSRNHWPWDRKRKLSQSKSSSTQPRLQPPHEGSRAVSEETSSSSSSEDEDDPGASVKTGLCIGSIFGLDVGGTLAKLVYFERDPVVPQSRRHKDPMFSSFTEASSVNDDSLSRSDQRRSSREIDYSSVSSDDADDAWRKMISQHRRGSPSLSQDRIPLEIPIMTDMETPKYVDSEDFLEDGNAAGFDDDHASAVARGMSLRGIYGANKNQKSATRSASDVVHPLRRIHGQTNAMSARSISENVRLIPSTKAAEHAEALNKFYHFARHFDTYGSGQKEKHLSYHSRYLGGEFHFIRFETRKMESAMDLIRTNNLHLNICEMGATGGGAYKYAADWERVLGIRIVKQDEMDSMVAGMQFVLADVVGECYTFQPQEENNHGKESGHPSSDLAASKKDTSNRSEDLKRSDQNQPPGNSARNAANVFRPEEWWFSRKVQRDVVGDTVAYPYLVVSIGTGVSIVRVDGPRKHERVSGSSIGGGTYWGLCRLLTDVEEFADALKLAEKGDPSKVDMMVGDIYGGKSDAIKKLGLSTNIVASSFGKLVAKQDPAAGVNQEDLAGALLVMVTNNIGQVAYLNARLHKTRRIYFVGNFLRDNVISQRRLAHAINYWSKGQTEALFLEHEGYFGALGAFLLSQGISASRRHSRKKKHATPMEPSANVSSENSTLRNRTFSS